MGLSASSKTDKTEVALNTPFRFGEDYKNRLELV